MRTALLVSLVAAALVAPTVSAMTTGLRGLRKAGQDLLLATHTDRPAKIILPSNYKDKAAWPVIMVLHVRLFFRFKSSLPSLSAFPCLSPLALVLLI
jgi:hypothetical protein